MIKIDWYNFWYKHGILGFCVRDDRVFSSAHFDPINEWTEAWFIINKNHRNWGTITIWHRRKLRKQYKII